MAFTVGDEVVYNGSLGRHDARVQAVHDSGAIDVMTEHDGLIRTDADSLYGRFAEGGLMAAGPTGFGTGAPVPAGELLGVDLSAMNPAPAEPEQ